MFDFVPIEIYTAVYYNVLFIIMLLIIVAASIFPLQDPQNISFSHVIGYILLFWSIIYIGVRPISWKYFGDMSTYAKHFQMMKAGQVMPPKNDFVFSYFMKFCSSIMDVTTFFIVTMILYIVPFFLFSIKFLRNYWFFGFFLFLGAFSFWGYAVNGIRNGIATSVFILAICFYNRKLIVFPLLLLSYGIHNSMLIPIAAFVISYFWTKPVWYVYFWLFTIPLSLLAGGFFQNLFSELFTSDSRATNYLTKEMDPGSFSSTGFRWDFVLYSAAAVFTGYYFIVKRKMVDHFYFIIFSAYVIANAFWILVIRANFSNRFAYLSWFLIPIIIGYPILKYKVWKSPYVPVALIITAYYLFTYLMFLKG